MSKVIVLSLGVLIGLLILLSTAAAPLVESNTADPETFEVAGKTCIYFKGQLECVCPCGTAQCSEANVITVPETRVITVPQPIVVTVVETVPVPVQFAPGAEGALAPVRWDTYAPISGIEPTPGQEWNPVGMPILEPGQSENAGDDDNPGNSQGPNSRGDCNQGVGNGAEGCDPGNSNNNQPSNDEDGGVPGAPGRAHNKDSRGKDE